MKTFVNKKLKFKGFKGIVFFVLLSIFAASAIPIISAEEVADMSVSPSSVDLQIDQGGSETFQLTVYNSESDWLRNVTLSIDKIQDWVTFDKQNFDVGPEGYEYVNPTIEVPYSAIRGKYTATITLKSDNGGTQYVDLSVTVKGAELECPPFNEIVKENIVSTEIVNIPIKNVGNAVLRNVQLTASSTIADYIQFDDTGFNVNVGATKTVIATITPPSEAGTYKGTINLKSNNGGSCSIDVTLTVQGIGLKVNPKSISLEMMQSEASATIISLENPSVFPINITIQKSGTIRDWISLSRNTTVLPPKGFQTVSVTVTVPKNTGDGIYSGTINVLSTGGGGVTVPVEVVVNSACDPSIEITSSDIDMMLSAGSMHKKFIDISNTGCQILKNVQLKSTGLTGDWIVFDKQGFSIGPSGDRSVKATIKIPSDALSGTYTGKITVTGTTEMGNDVSYTMNVKIDVTEPSVLKVTPASLGVIRASPSVTIPKTLCLENTGDSTLTGVHLEVQGTLSDWVKFDKQDFSVKSKESKCIKMEVTPSDNAVLTEYKDTLLITADNDLHLNLDLVVDVNPPISSSFLASPSNLNIFVESGTSKTDTIKFTDMTSDFKHVYFNVIGDVASLNLIKLDKEDVIFSGDDRSKELTYTVTLPDAFKGVAEGAIVLSGDLDMKIPVTISTNKNDEIKVKNRVVSVPDITANSGDQIDVPINIENATNVGAVDIVLNYNAKVLSAISVTSGSLTKGASLAYNINENGSIAISLASPYGFTGTGSIATLNFKVIGNNGDISHLILSNVELSDATTYDKIQVTTKDGSVTVESITPQPTETVVSVKNYNAEKGKTIDIPIDMTKAQTIGSMDITLTYDSSVLTATKVTSGTLTSGSTVMGNTATLGTVTIGIMDVFGFSGDGSIAKITFEVIGNDGDTSSLTLTSVSASDTDFNDVPLTTQNGKFTVGTSPCGVAGDLNGDGKVSSLDALMALQMSVGLIQVDQCADVNGNGKVTSLDALMILQKAVGLIEF